MFGTYYFEKTLSYIKILLGTFLTAASFGLFIIPAGYCAAGVTGFSRAVSFIIPLPVSTLVLIFNIGLLILGLVTLGYEVVLKSIAVSLLFPIFLDIFTKMDMHLENAPAPVVIIIAGMTLGCGIGMILKCNSSAGGFDLLGLVLNKKLGLPIAVVMNVCDSIVILLQAISQPKLLPIIYGLCVIFISNICVGAFTSQSSQLSLSEC